MTNGKLTCSNASSSSCIQYLIQLFGGRKPTPNYPQASRKQEAAVLIKYKRQDKQDIKITTIL